MKKERITVTVVIFLLVFAIIPSINADMNNINFKQISNPDYHIDNIDNDIETNQYKNTVSNIKSVYWWDRWPDFPSRYEPMFDVEDIEKFDQSAYGVTSADFNDDGLLDFAVSWSTVPWTQSSISIFYNDGDDGFTRDDVYTTTNSILMYIDDLDSGDFDNDGDIDLLYSNDDKQGSNDDSFVWLLRNDNNNFNDCIQVAEITEGYRINPQITTADFDNDSDIDFLIGDNSGQVEFFKNDGAGSFHSEGIYDFGGEMSWGLTSSDFDNDGDIDFLLALRQDLSVGYIYLVRNDGSDSCFNHSDFIQIAEIDPNMGIFFTSVVSTWGCLHSIDYNDDEMMDFVYAGSESVFLYMQKESDLFECFHIMRLPGVPDGYGGWYIDTLNKGGISVGDFNGDNLIDIVIGGIQGVVRMCYNNRVLVDIVKPDKAGVYMFNELNYDAPFPFKYPIMIYPFLQKGTSIAIGGLKIEAKALEPLQKVEFYLGTRLMYTDETEPFELEWTSLSFGRRKVTAMAYDVDGEPAGSDDTFVWKFL